jgi:hypothetical protein
MLKESIITALEPPGYTQNRCSIGLLKWRLTWDLSFYKNPGSVIQVSRTGRQDFYRKTPMVVKKDRIDAK